MTHFVPREDAEWHQGRRIVPTRDNTKWVTTMAELRAAGGKIHFTEDQAEIYLTLPAGHKFGIRFPEGPPRPGAEGGYEKVKAPKESVPGFRIDCIVSPEVIANLMISAIEQPVGGWCQSIVLADGIATEKPWYAGADLYRGKFELEVVEITDERTGRMKKHRVGNDAFVRGLGLMLQKSPKHFAAILADDTDAVTADVMLQYVTLGDIVYG